MARPQHVSLARYAALSVTTAVIAVIAAASIGLWALQREAHKQDGIHAGPLARAVAGALDRHLQQTQTVLMQLAAKTEFADLLRRENVTGLQRWARETRAQLPESLALTVITPTQVLGDPLSAADSAPELARLRARLGAREAPLPFVRGQRLVWPLVLPAEGARPAALLLADFNLRFLEDAIRPWPQEQQAILVHDAAGAQLVQVGDADATRVRAEAPMQFTPWRVKLAGRTAAGWQQYGLVIACFVLLAVLYLSATLHNRGLLLATTRHLGQLRDFLQRIGHGSHIVDIPAAPVTEVEALAAEMRALAQAQEKRQEALAEQSLLDPVTGLPYRVAFHDRLRHAFELARRGHPMCLLVLEVNGLDEPLKVLGVNAVDTMLKLLADSLRTHTRKSDFVARIGMHQFAVVFYNAKGELMQPRLEKIRNDFTERQRVSVETAGKEWCTTNLGLIPIDPSRSEKPEEVLHRAQEALGAARTNGGIRIVTT